MTFYLGIVGLGDHDAAAAIVDENGRVLAAAEEERYTRIKFDPSFPVNSIRCCLAAAGITIEDVAEIGYYFEPRLYSTERLVYGIWNLHHIPTLIKKAVKFSKFSLAEQNLRKFGYKGKISFIPHHLCHAASVFFASPFEQATIVSIDGVGEWETAWIGLGRGKDLIHKESTLWPHSLGMVYAAFTQFLGLKFNSDEYKVMGLAAYGVLSYYDQFKDVLKIDDDMRFTVNDGYFRYPYGSDILFGRRCETVFGKPNVRFEEPSSRDKDLAASLQKRVEDCFLSYVTRAVNLTGVRNVCITGGVALNCVAIGKIIESKIADSVYLGPASSDAGCALGAAFYLANSRSSRSRRSTLLNANLGDSFSDETIRTTLDRSNIRYENCGDSIGERTAELIAQGKVIAWFQGRTEYGQRALGARSILANPTIADMKRIINQKVKFREPFRPLAPSIIKEEVDKYFDCRGDASPFMTHTFRAFPGAAQSIPAVIHVDGTARVHTVSHDENPHYYQLIRAVGQKTGHPVVLNTSFNVKGEPIVNSPLDAINCFTKTELDALAIGRFLVKRDAV